MNYSNSMTEARIARLHHLVPDGEDLRDFVRRMLDDEIALVSSDTQMGIVPPSVLSAKQMLASARLNAELLNAPSEFAARPEGIVDIGTIEWLLRPSLPLKDDLIVPVQSGMWAHFGPDVVERQSAAVCRLDVTVDASAPIHIGTGFVAGEDAKGRPVIVTNAHVVDEVVRIGWPANERIVLGCDFSRFSANIDGELWPAELEYKLHPNYDMALLHLGSGSTHRGMSIKPLPIAGTTPEEIVDLQIGVVGHPAFDSRRDQFPQIFGFGHEFGIKRFSPGFVKTVDERMWRGNVVRVFLHDATTLSGSSGSCIFDLKTMNVVGLHFGGWPLHKRNVTTHTGDEMAELFESNGAIPLWTLAQDPFCADLSFNDK